MEYIIKLTKDNGYELQKASVYGTDSIALLIVSDNSATGQPLVGRNEELEAKYNYGRKVIIPDLIYKIAKGE